MAITITWIALRLINPQLNITQSSPVSTCYRIIFISIDQITNKTRRVFELENGSADTCSPPPASRFVGGSSENQFRETKKSHTPL